MPQDRSTLTLGDKAPAFALRTSEGREVQLSDILRTKAVILVFIRGTW